MKYLVSLAMILVVSALARGFFVAFVPPGDPSQQVVFDVPPHTPFVRVAKNLEAQGLIFSSLEFRIFAKLVGLQSQVKVGEYELHRGMNAFKIMDVLTSGHGIMHPVTFPEGMNTLEMAEKLEAEGFFTRDAFLKVIRDPGLVKELLGESRPSLEGYLFPETYQITKYGTPVELVRSMVTRFFEVYNKAVEPHTRVKMSRHEIVILASIIEKETGATEERALVSSVFHNRLAKHMRLQTDPTVLYGIYDQTKEWKKNITKDDLLTPNRYNTYTLEGLPFGPISNPGAASLVATVQPENTEFLFFVSKNDGTHVFSKSLEEHNKGVKKFQLNPKERSGKSWRDLSKRIGNSTKK